MDFSLSKWLVSAATIPFILFIGCKSESLKIETTFTFNARPDYSCMIELSHVATESYEVGKALVTFNDGVTNDEKDFMTEMFGLSIFAKNDESNQQVLNVPAGEEKEWVCTFVSINIVRDSELSYYAIAIE